MNTLTRLAAVVVLAHHTEGIALTATQPTWREASAGIHKETLSMLDGLTAGYLDPLTYLLGGYHGFHPRNPVGHIEADAHHHPTPPRAPHVHSHH